MFKSIRLLVLLYPVRLHPARSSQGTFNIYSRREQYNDATKHCITGITMRPKSCGRLGFCSGPWVGILPGNTRH